MPGLSALDVNIASHNLQTRCLLDSMRIVECVRLILKNPLVIQKQSRIHCIIRGLTGEYWPDHRGFTAVVDSDELSSKKNYFHYGVNVQFIAVGY